MLVSKLLQTQRLVKTKCLILQLHIYFLCLCCWGFCTKNTWLGSGNHHSLSWNTCFSHSNHGLEMVQLLEKKIWFCSKKWLTVTPGLLKNIPWCDSNCFEALLACNNAKTMTLQLWMWKVAATTTPDLISSFIWNDFVSVFRILSRSPGRRNQYFWR